MTPLRLSTERIAGVILQLCLVKQVLKLEKTYLYFFLKINNFLVPS